MYYSKWQQHQLKIKEVFINMEFNRANRPLSAPATTRQAAPEPEVTATPNRKRNFRDNKLLTIVSALLLASVTILVSALLWLVVRGKPNTEMQLVDTSKYQAVFLNKLNTGFELYFGHVTDLNDQYVRLKDVYYLRVNQAATSTSKDGKADAAAAEDAVSLVKLGCELHAPTDQVVLNRDHVMFWENLKDDGQVAKAIAEFVEKNPNGQTCQTTES